MPFAGAQRGSKWRSPMGFSLIELLIALAIVGALLTLLPPFLTAGNSATEGRAAALQIAALLREARGTAIGNDQQARVVLDLEARAVIGARGDEHPLPSHVALVFQGPRSEVEGQRAAIRFFGDGSSTGGRVVITADGRKHHVSAHWLTGRVAVDE